jgi:hypothetical protein
MKTRRTNARRRRRSPVFSAWLVVQRGPCCKRWRSFGTFYADVGKCPSWRHLLMRTDTSAQFSPGNCRWQRMVHIDLYANEADCWRIHLG